MIPGTTSLTLHKRDDPLPLALGIGAQLLVADDDADTRSMIVCALMDAGYDVYEASTGRGLLRALSALTPTVLPPFGIALVLSDIRMPGISGLEATAALRASGCATPVILMTAFPEPAVTAEASHFGALLLEKPFRTRQLLDLVHWTLLGRDPSAPRRAATVRS
jgi:CheY-like chemotaxis protein